MLYGADKYSEGSPAHKEELFGPVASVFRAKDADDAIRIANDSRFGLGRAPGRTTRMSANASSMTWNLEWFS